MMPYVDGLEVCKYIRDKSKRIGIIMLTARTQEMDKVTGLMTGADDYVTKPFNILELKARVKAILRRVTPIAHNGSETLKMNMGSVELDYNRRTVTIGEKTVDLTGKEFDLLDLLVTNAGKVYSRESLLDLV